MYLENEEQWNPLVEGGVWSPVSQFGSHVGVVVVDIANSDVEEFILDQDGVEQAANIALVISGL